MIKEIEQTDLYRQVKEEGITVWRLRELPTVIFVIVTKLNEIVRIINDHETAQRKTTNKL